MDISSQIIPAVIILSANLLSGKHSSLRWDVVTAIFGWGALISFVGYIISISFFPVNELSNYLIQTAAFCLITALCRDYEKILRPLFPWNRS